LVDFETLYLVKDPLSRRAPRGAVRLNLDRDPAELFTGAWRPTAPVRIEIGGRGKPAQILWTEEPAVILFADAVTEALTRDALTGWAPYAVQLAWAGVAADRYEGLAVLGRCGPIDWTRGEWVRTADEPGPSLKGLYFDESSWDGSDVFSPKDSFFVLVTERARACLSRHVGGSCRFVRLSEHLTSEVVVRHSIPKPRK
jgi:hypothetical protein